MKYIMDELKDAKSLQAKIDKLKIPQESNFFDRFASVEYSEIAECLVFMAHEYYSNRVFWVPPTLDIFEINTSIYSEDKITRYTVTVSTNLATFVLKGLPSEYKVVGGKAYNDFQDKSMKERNKDKK